MASGRWAGIALATGLLVTTAGTAGAQEVPPPPAPPTGTITVVKDARPNAYQDFRFTTGGFPAGPSGFTLDDDPVSATPRSVTIADLPPGTYRVTEQRTEGWDLHAVDCTGGATPRRDGQTLFVTIPEEGGVVTCTFVNVKVDTGNVEVPPAAPPEAAPTKQPAAPVEQGRPTAPPKAVTGAQGGAVPAPKADETDAAAKKLGLLPRTGTSPATGAAAGFALVALGLALVRAGRRRLAESGSA